MPFGDGTGPAGLGPMTGRAAGYCAGYGVPGYMNPLPGRAVWARPYLGAVGLAPVLRPYGVWATGPYGAGLARPLAPAFYGGRFGAGRAWRGRGGWGFRARPFAFRGWAIPAVW